MRVLFLQQLVERKLPAQKNYHEDYCVGSGLSLEYHLEAGPFILHLQLPGEVEGQHLPSSHLSLLEVQFGHPCDQSNSVEDLLVSPSPHVLVKNFDSFPINSKRKDIREEHVDKSEVEPRGKILHLHMVVLHKFEDMDESLGVFVKNAGMVCVYPSAHLFADIFEPLRLKKQGLMVEDCQEEMVDSCQSAVLVLPK